MQCRRCAPLSQPVVRSLHAAGKARVWGADRIHGLLCDICGAVLSADDIAHLLLEKQSQLAQFGLLRPRGLRERIRLEDD
jgi:hypothetical protein